MVTLIKAANLLEIYLATIINKIVKPLFLYQRNLCSLVDISCESKDT